MCVLVLYGLGCVRRKLLLKGRLCIVDLLVPSSLDQFLFESYMSFTFVTKQATLMRRSIVLNLPAQLVFPDVRIDCVWEGESLCVFV